MSGEAGSSSDGNKQSSQGAESGPSQHTITDSSSSVPASSGYSTEDTIQSGGSTQADVQGSANSVPVIMEGSRSAGNDDEMEIVEAGETVVYSTSQIAEHSSRADAKSAEQPLVEPEQEEQSNHATGGEEETAIEENASNQQQPDTSNQQQPDASNQQQPDSSKGDTVIREPPHSKQKIQHQHDQPVGENTTELESDQAQATETAKSNEPCSEMENQKEPVYIDVTEEETKDDEQQPKEHMDDNPPSLEAEQQHQEQQEEKTTERPQPGSSEHSTAEENIETEDNNTKASANQPSNEVNNDVVADADNQPELMPANKDSQLEDERTEEISKETETGPEVIDKEAETQNEISKEESVVEKVTNEETSKTDVTSTEEDKAAETEQVTEEPPAADKQPPKDRVAAESFTLELDEDPLGNSSMFLEDEHNNEVLVDPDTSPPVSKKRKGNPRKLGTRTTRSKSPPPAPKPKTTSTKSPKKKPLSKGPKKQPAKPAVSKKEKAEKKQPAASKQNKQQPMSSTPKEKPEQPQPDTSTPNESNQLQEIMEMDTKRMPPKQRRVRRKITLPGQIVPASSGQSQEQETSTVSQEKVAVIECTNAGELPSVEEPSVPEESAPDEVVAEKRPVIKKSSRVKKTAAKQPIVDEPSVEEPAVEEEPSVNDPSMEEPSVEEPSVEEPSVEEPSAEEPSIDDPSLEEGPSVELPPGSIDDEMGGPHSSKEQDFDWTPAEGDEDMETSEDVYLGDDSMTTNVSKSSSRSSPSVRTPWEIAEKRMLVAEAKQWGIRPTARRHNMSFSTLRVWMMQDFGDLPGTKKRLPGGGRPLRYDQSIDVTLKDWVLQKMAMKERVSHEELRKKAMALILPFNPNFQASQGWITRFLYRHEINLKTMVHGKDAHSPRVKQFSSPSKKTTPTPKSTPKSAPKSSASANSTPLGKRKRARSPNSTPSRKQPKRETPKKADLSIFDFED